LPPLLIRAIANLKIDGSYPLLYQDEGRIVGCTLIALFGEDGYREAARELAGMALPEVVSAVHEFASNFDDALDDGWVIPKSEAEQERARELFARLPPEEQAKTLRAGQFFYSGFLAAFYQYLSLMVHGEKLTALVTQGIAGNDEALCKAVQIDRNILYAIPPIRNRYTRAQMEGDAEFLDSLAYRMRNPVAKGKIRHRILWISLAVLDGFEILNSLSYPSLLEVLDSAGLDRWENRIEDVTNLAKRVREYRAFQRKGAVAST
jgi:hypothetical protein